MCSQDSPEANEPLTPPLPEMGMDALLDLLWTLSEEARETTTEMSLLRIDLEALRAEVRGLLHTRDIPEAVRRLSIRIDWIEDAIRANRASVTAHLDRHHHVEQAEKDAAVSFGFWTDLMDSVHNLFVRRR
mgnify:CR=1 FL=1